MTPEEVRRWADRIYYPFTDRDWTYTRYHGLKHIRHKDDYSGSDAIPRRVQRAFKHLFQIRFEEWEKTLRGKTLRDRLLSRWYGFLIALETPNNLPDGQIGGAYTIWEEQADYIITVRPSVGDEIAKFLRECPDNPYAIAIATEVKRAVETGYKDCSESA